MDIAKEPGTEKRGGKAGRILSIIGTILLIGVVTGLIFVCIFAFYVKTHLGGRGSDPAAHEGCARRH